MSPHDSSETSPTAVTTAIRLHGPDALPLLHRVSTNVLLDLAPGEARPTLFCDFRGRLFHRAVVYLARDRAVWLLRDDAPGADLAAFVDRVIFRDQVTLDDRSPELAVARLEPAEPTRERDGVPHRVTTGGETLAVGDPAAPADERARILAGRPAHGHEIVEAYNPFEVGLGDEVHLDKGCFTGQEALQRLVTYDSVRRRLARVVGRGQPPAVPAVLESEGERVGSVTSVAGDGTERWIGLAVLRKEALGAILTLDALPLLESPEPLDAPRPLGRP